MTIVDIPFLPEHRRNPFAGGLSGAGAVSSVAGLVLVSRDGTGPHTYFAGRESSSSRSEGRSLPWVLPISLRCGGPRWRNLFVRNRKRATDARYWDLGSLFREFGVAATATRCTIAVSREEHPGPALRTIRSLPGHVVAVDLVELPLEACGAFFLLRLGHHLPSFFLAGSPFFSPFGSAFLGSFFSSFFSAGFFSSFAAGFFSSFAGAFSAFASCFSSAFAGSTFGAAGLSVLGAGFSGFGAPSFSLTSGAMSLFRTRMCLRSTARASSFDL